MDHRHLNKELLRITFCDLMGVVIPLATLKVHSVQVAAAFRLFLDILEAHLIFILVAEC